MYFKFNGKDSKQWGYDLTASLIIESLDNIEGEQLKVSNNYVEKFVRIKKVNRVTDEILKFTKLEIDMINRWLFEEDYKVLEIGVYCYNAIFKRRKFMWRENNGYIDLIIRLYPNALSCKIINQTTLINDTITSERVINEYQDEKGEWIYEYEEYELFRGEKTITINNKSNIDNLKLNTELQIILKDENANSVTIENLTNNKVTTFAGLEEFENFYVDGKNEYIVSNIDNNRDLYNKFNGTYLTFDNGINEIKISSNGFARVLIKHQQEFSLEEVWLK